MGKSARSPQVSSMGTGHCTLGSPCIPGLWEAESNLLPSSSGDAGLASQRAEARGHICPRSLLPRLGFRVPWQEDTPFISLLGSAAVPQGQEAPLGFCEGPMEPLGRGGPTDTGSEGRGAGLVWVQRRRHTRARCLFLDEVTRVFCLTFFQ